MTLVLWDAESQLWRSAGEPLTPPTAGFGVDSFGTSPFGG